MLLLANFESIVLCLFVPSARKASKGNKIFFSDGNENLCTVIEIRRTDLNIFKTVKSSVQKGMGKRQLK